MFDPPPATAAAPVNLLTPGRHPRVEEVEEGLQVARRPAVDLAALERAGLFDWTHGRSRISEEFRLAQRQLLRTAFAPTAEAGLSNLLMVTSARPGEGKSFTALNLACSVALQGDHHVLLIDSDSKRDSILPGAGPRRCSRSARPRGQSRHLIPASVLLQTEIEHLSILPVGQERSRSPELFASRDMTQLIQSLGRRYSDRLLILDAAPCLSTSDPAALAPWWVRSCSSWRLSAHSVMRSRQLSI